MPGDLERRIGGWSRRVFKNSLRYWLQRGWLSFDELQGILAGLRGERVDAWALIETKRRSSSEFKAERKGKKTFDTIEEV